MGEFNDSSNSVANFYCGLGISKGHRVGILMMNCAEWLPVYFGVLKSAALAVPLNFRYGCRELLQAVRYARLDALVFDCRGAEAVLGLREELSGLSSLVFIGPEERRPDLASSWAQSYGTASVAEPQVSLTLEDEAAIYFSSGTTGVPKAVVYTHNSLAQACVREQLNHKQTREDVFICIPPLYHVGGMLHWSGNLLMGAKGVLLLGFTVDALWETMEREKVSIAFLLVPWIQDMLEQIDEGAHPMAEHELSHWRLLHMGAQPIPPTLVKRLLEVFPSVSLDISYGLTESGGPGILNLGSENITRFGSVGRPSGGWEAKIVNDNDVQVPTGEIGELLARGPGVMSYYMNNEEATASALKDGWLHTGDMATCDEDGFYYIVDRKKDIIISGGENIFPIEIENHLRLLDCVADVAVFGVKHPRLGEAVAAAIEWKPGRGMTEDELNEYCAALPKYERPKHFFFFDRIPRNPTGKVNKVKLRKMYSNIG